MAFVTFEAATPIQEWQRFVAYGAILAVAIALGRVKIVWLLKRLALALPFVIAVAISVFMVEPTAEELVMVGGLKMSRPVHPVRPIRSRTCLIRSQSFVP